MIFQIPNSRLYYPLLTPTTTNKLLNFTLPQKSTTNYIDLQGRLGGLHVVYIKPLYINLFFFQRHIFSPLSPISILFSYLSPVKPCFMNFFSESLFYFHFIYLKFEEVSYVVRRPKMDMDVEN